MSAALAAPDRPREARAARRRELVALRRRLDGGRDAELRAALERARLRCCAELADDLDALGLRASEHLHGAGRSGRAHFPGWLARELDAIGDRSAERFTAAAGPAVARVAARRCPGAAPLPLPGPGRADVRLPAPGPGTHGAPSAELIRTAADPRLLGGLAGVPVLGAGGIGWPAALTAVGVLVLLATVVGVRAAAAERARCRDEAARTIAAAARAGERELRRRCLDLEPAVLAALERAVTEQRCRVDAELAALEDLDAPR